MNTVVFVKLLPLKSQGTYCINDLKGTHATLFSTVPLTDDETPVGHLVGDVLLVDSSSDKVGGGRGIDSGGACRAGRSCCLHVNDDIPDQKNG